MVHYLFQRVLMYERLICIGYISGRQGLPISRPILSDQETTLTFRTKERES